MNLDVPAFRQSKGSVLCGPTCAKMVLAYHGIEMSLDKIAEEMSLIKLGAYIGRIGSFFAAKGFETTIKVWVRGLPPAWWGAQVVSDSNIRLSSKNHRKFISHAKVLKYKPVPRSSKSFILERPSLLKFAENGGTLILKPVQGIDVMLEIEAEQPPILELNSALLYEAGGQKNYGHFIVPTGFSAKDSQVTQTMITYNDPFSGKEESRYMEEIMYFSHIWLGSCLFIKKTK